MKNLWYANGVNMTCICFLKSTTGRFGAPMMTMMPMEVRQRCEVTELCRGSPSMELLLQRTLFSQVSYYRLVPVLQDFMDSQ